MNWDRYNTIRKRLAPLAFVLALGFLVHQTCRGKDRHEVTIVLDLAPWAERVRMIDGDLTVGTAVIGHFHSEMEPGHPVDRVTFKAPVPDDSPELTLHVTLVDGVRELHKHMSTPDGATVTVPLGADLAPAR